MPEDSVHTTFYQLVKAMQSRNPSISLLDLMSNFGIRDVTYLLGGKARRLEIAPNLEYVFAPNEKFLYLMIKEQLMLLRKLGFDIRKTGSLLKIQHNPYLANPILVEIEKFEKRELLNLLSLLRYALKYGIVFRTERGPSPNKKFLVFYPSERIVEVNSGVRFYLGFLDPWTLVETFYLQIHSFAELKGKILIDIGAEFGDSSLFFATNGAIVYAIEPVDVNFDAIIRNIALNPTLGQRIKPIRAAFGRTGTLRIGYNPVIINGRGTAITRKGASLIATQDVESYTLSDLLDKLKIDYVDV